jgi:hypothetical protein
VATRIYEQNEFEHFLTIFFNHDVAAMPTSNLEDFKDKAAKVQAKSTTNFSVVFKKIVSYCDKKTPEDLTVLFLTDGNDTCNAPGIVDAQLVDLKLYLKEKEISSRFFTIGLSGDHDSILLSKIAQAGSDLGNFFYVDYNDENQTLDYKEIIKECLVKTFEMGIPGKSLSVNVRFDEINERAHLIPEELSEEEQKKLEADENPDQIFEGNLILESLPKDELEIQLVGKEHSIFVKPLESQNVNTEKALKTEIGIINKVFFDFIQQVVNQSDLGNEEGKKIYEKITTLDDRVSRMIEEGFKIKDKETRKRVIQACQNFKEKCSTVMETLRDVIINNKTMDLVRIAKLNDLAYKAIRSRGLKKRLDERAMKNEEYYKELDEQIKKKIETFNFAELSEKHKDIIELIGDCPLTCLNAIEALEEGD